MEGSRERMIFWGDFIYNYARPFRFGWPATPNRKKTVKKTQFPIASSGPDRSFSIPFRSGGEMADTYA